MPSEQTYSLETKAKLLGSPLLFTRAFYKIRTGREFKVSFPVSRESHIITICRALKRVFDGKCKRLIINVPPRYGKTELLIHFVAYAMARYPDCNFLYTSYSGGLAKKQTGIIKQIISLPKYRELFHVELRDDTTAKGNFETTQGGTVYAAGAAGEITGRGAGILGAERFSGCIVIDDIHKPVEVTSDIIRQSIIDWYSNTLKSRLNSPENTPIIFIGQRLHEADLPAWVLQNEKDEWETVVIPALDGVQNALDPERHTREQLLKMEETDPYNFAAQYQQNPQPSGGGIFKPEWFELLDEDPEMLATFITADTAETSENYNDATVFSFWGVYRIKERDVDVDLLGLHWIDCVEIRVEPKDLESEFRQFYSECLMYKKKPQVAAIEKKSTGSTLLSVLGSLRGLQLVDIERTKASGGKTARFLEIQKFIASKRVSLPRYGKHTEMCIEHCRKITANQSHRFDDIADTLYDAVKIGLINELISRSSGGYATEADKLVEALARQNSNTSRLMNRAYYDRTS